MVRTTMTTTTTMMMLKNKKKPFYISGLSGANFSAVEGVCRGEFSVRRRGEKRPR
jgi:hypothetical protein